eukprot:2388297-Prorocentrum_lima.AAC.1
MTKRQHCHYGCGCGCGCRFANGGAQWEWAAERLDEAAPESRTGRLDPTAVPDPKAGTKKER